ncbi:secretin N-terminal domain-containing protein [Fimbriiglobus ruber]|uniref:PE-PGRS family protein n=1 Tax=Fimbriiglobus ruber TaxID=1908690 RepID=A0A225DKP5_9BACT|nr:secretin N-terminal domain-containing protein [Fimbriiglobus ruber]OWK37749.1 PE-PGRS family protein [Fimbriiglobus ruber]
MIKRIAALATLGALLAQPTVGHAQRPNKPDATASSSTPSSLYTVRNVDPAALAEAVGAHFQGRAKISVVPGSNHLLISGSSPGTVADLGKLLGELDQRPKTIEVEVVLAEIVQKKGDGGDQAAPDLAGPAAELTAKLDALGKGASVQRFKLTTTEGLPTSVTSGGNRPYVTGTTIVAGGPFGGGAGDGPASINPDGSVTRGAGAGTAGPGNRAGAGAGGAGRGVTGGGFAGGGPAAKDGPGGPGGGGRAAGGGPGIGARVQRSISYHQSGTTIKATARAVTENAVVVDLNLNDSGLKAPESGDEYPAFDSSTLTTTLTIPPGRVVTAQTVNKDGKAGRTVTLVLVTARVVEPGAKADKTPGVR